MCKSINNLRTGKKMKVQSTINNQTSTPAFGKIYTFSAYPGITEELGKLLVKKGAKPTRDFIAGSWGKGEPLYMATGKDSFYPAFGMPTNGLFTLSDKIKKAGKKVVDIVLDSEKGLEEQLNITLKTINKKGTQEIEISKK